MAAIIAAANVAIACGDGAHRLRSSRARCCYVRQAPCGCHTAQSERRGPQEEWRERVRAYVRDLESGRESWPNTAAEEIRRRFARYTSNPTVIVKALTDVLLRDPSPLFRDRAATLIRRLRDPAAAPELRTALGDSEASVRATVCLALVYVDDRKSIGKLQNVLRNDQDPLVRRCAAQALKYLADPAAVTSLANALKNDADEDVRRDAGDALGAIGGTAAIDTLKAALLDRGQAVRAASKDALAALGALELPLRGIEYEPIDRNAYESLRSQGRVRRETARDGFVYFEVDEPLDVRFADGTAGWFNERHWYRTSAPDDDP